MHVWLHVWLHFGDGTYCSAMEAVGIEQALSAAEVASNREESLAGTGFWQAVARVKADPELIDRYADRIALIDQRSFGNWALVVVPAWIGTLMMSLATVGGLVFVGVSYDLTDLMAVLVFYVGFWPTSHVKSWSRSSHCGAGVRDQVHVVVHRDDRSATTGSKG